MDDDTKKAHETAVAAYDGEDVDSSLLQNALDFLVDIEPHPTTFGDMDEYDKIMEPYEENIKKANAIVRKFGEQINPRTLAHMQEIYYSITNSEKYLKSAVAASVVQTTLEHEWDGIGPWKA